MSKPSRKDKRVVQPRNDKESPKTEKVQVKRNRPSHLFVFGILLVLSMIFYGNTIGNGYSMDDELVAAGQPNVEQGFAGIPSIITSRYVKNAKQNYEYRPIALISFAIEFQFFGKNPAASHFFNILIYAFCGFLVYYLTSKLFLNYHWILPLITVLIFILHPLHSEVVASLKNRDELFSLIFSLLSLNAFLNFNDRRKWWYVLLGSLFIILAIFSKKSAMPFLFIIPFTIFYIRKTKLVHVALFSIAIFGCSYLIGRLFIEGIFDEANSSHRSLLFFENPLYVSGYGIGDKLMMSIATFGYYIKMFIAPFPLISYYGYNTFDGFSFGLYHIIGLVAIAIFMWLMIKTYKKDPLIFYSIVLICVSLSMFVNLVIPAVGIVAERFAFQSSFGWSIFMAGILFSIFKLNSKSENSLGWSIVTPNMRYVLVVFTVISAIIVIPRNKDWKSAQSLYFADILKVPNSAKMNSLVGTQFAFRLSDHMRGVNRQTPEQLSACIDSSIRYFRKALKVYPDYPAVNNNLGTIYFNYRSQLDSAGYYFSRALKVDSAYVEAYFNMGAYYEHVMGMDQMYVLWLKSILLADSLADDASGKDIWKKIEENKEVFYHLSLVSSNLQQVFKNAIEGKIRGNFQEHMLNVFSVMNKKLPIEVVKSIDINPLLQNVSLFYKELSDKGDYRQLSSRTDSLVIAAYAPAVKSDLEKRLKISIRSSDAWIRDGERQLKATQENFIQCNKKTFQLKNDHWMAYSKLIQFLSQWNRTDELIAIHQMALKSPSSKKSSVYFNLAEAYILTNKFDDAKNATKSALENIELQVKNIQSCINDFTKSENAMTASTMHQQKQNVIKNLEYYLNRIIVSFNKEGRTAESKLFTDKYKKIIAI